MRVRRNRALVMVGGNMLRHIRNCVSYYYYYYYIQTLFRQKLHTIRN